MLWNTNFSENHAASIFRVKEKSWTYHWSNGVITLRDPMGTADKAAGAWSWSLTSI